MNRAIYAGTFDPFTNGHLDIVQRALGIFDHLTILLAVSPSKTPLIPSDERKEVLQKLFADNDAITVDSWQGLIVDYAKKSGINHLIRGLRPSGDFEIEFQMASMNGQLHPEIETVFLMAGTQHYYVSSSIVKEIFTHKGDISPFVPNLVLESLQKHHPQK